MDTGKDSRMDGVEVHEAAEILGISQSALRKRIQRGTIQSYKVDGRLYVVLTDEDYRQLDNEDGSRDINETSSTDYHEIVQAYQELVSSQKEEIQFLRQELAARSEEVRFKDRLLANQTQTIDDLMRRLELPEKASVSQSQQQERLEQEINVLRDEVAATRDYIDRQEEERERRTRERDERVIAALNELREQRTEQPKSFWKRLTGK